MKPEQIFLEVAVRDLEASKLLLDHKFYAHSIFFLEQSVEKTVKSYGMWSKSITLSEAKGFEHNAWKVFSRIRNRVTASVSSILANTEITSKLIEDTKQWEELLRKLSKERKTDLTQRLPAILEIIEDSYADLEDVFRIADEELRKLKDEKDLEKRRINTRVSNSWKRASKLSFCFTYLLSMCRVFLPIYSKTRYPDANWNPIEAYSEKSPVVKLIPRFIQYQEKGLEVVKSIYDERALYQF